jgi:hypothetical protein
VNEGDYVAAFLEQVLDTIVATFDEAGVALPDRRFVTFGAPAADCSQVTVALQQIYLGTPGLPPTEPSSCSSPTTAVCHVEILRPVPIPEGRQTSVPVAEMVAAAQVQIRDAELLLLCVSRMCGAVWGNMGVFADVTMGAEQGGYAGPLMTLTIGVP